MVRSADVSVLAAAAVPTPSSEVPHIELHAAWAALVWASAKFGPCKIWVEGDSMAMIEQLNLDPNPLDTPLLADCKTTLHEMTDYRVTHIHREGNSGDDLMASWACVLDRYTLREVGFPAEFLRIVEKDQSSAYVRM